MSLVDENVDFPRTLAGMYAKICKEVRVSLPKVIQKIPYFKLTETIVLDAVFHLMIGVLTLKSTVNITKEGFSPPPRSLNPVHTPLALSSPDIST